MAKNHAQISNWRDALIPHVVDHLAEVSPSTPYALYPYSPTTYDDGYRTVTYKDFANAINGFAWWLKENLGPAKDFDVLAYIGPNDVRYTALCLGAVKAGYVAFFTSPRNSIAAHGALFDTLKCRTLLTPEPAPPATQQILGAHPMVHLTVPDVSYFVEKEHPHYPYDKTYESARSEPLVVVHTSGSTGVPKPLIWTHATTARHSNYCALEPPHGFRGVDKLHQGKRILNTFPPFHAAGLAIHLVHGPPFGTVSIAPLSGALPTAESIVQALKTAPVDVAFLVPSIIADLSEKPELLDYCSKNLELILYAGGDLPQSMGDKIAAKMPIRNNHGASEFGLIAELLAPEMTNADWHYVIPHPELGIVFEENTPGMFEMVIKKDPRFEKYQMPFTIGPSLQNLDEYRTKDLFVKHPSIPNCWAWKARADDIIVFLNGEKTNPVSMENHIVGSHEHITAALVFGMQKFQAGLLVETSPKLGKMNPDETAVFIDTIWAAVEEANKVTPAHARVEKSMIMLTSLDKPMIRSGKGTIQRQGTVALYAAEIEDLYLQADTAYTGAERASVNIKDADAVSQFLKRTISQVEPNLLQEGQSDFFALGMDSLMAVRWLRALRHGLGRPELDLSVIYNNPSVPLLTKYFVNGSSPHDVLELINDSSEMGALVKEYDPVISQITQQGRSPGTHNGEVVILTGSTGSLGIYLLLALLSNPSITHVYCLDRRAKAEELHKTKNKFAVSQLDAQRHRVTFLHAALDQADLGLEQKTYDNLCAQTSLIIHNAWTVNFMLPLHSFRPQLDGLVNLFRLASSRSDPARILYISSISSVAQFPRVSSSPSIPEEVIRNFGAPYEIGYAKSKLVSELLCDAASRKLGLPVSFARVGQIAGAIEGEPATSWNTAEWLPSLVVTSISLGALPGDLGAELNKVDWIPVDMLAQALVELGVNVSSESAGETSRGAQAFNVSNPRSTSWKDLLPSIVSSVKRYTGKEMEIVSPTTWLEKLQEVGESFSAANAADLVRKHPAIKLQEFYEARMGDGQKEIDWEMAHATRRSARLQSMSPVSIDWIDKWVKGWIDELRGGANM